MIMASASINKIHILSPIHQIRKSYAPKTANCVDLPPENPG